MKIHHRDTGSVLTLSQDDHPALAKTLERQLVNAIEEQLKVITYAQNWDDFQKRKGIIEGLNVAISICQTVQKKLEA